VALTKRKASRTKISTTVAPATYSYFQSLQRSGKAATLAEAVDLTVERLLQAENRARLARDTEAYFEGLSPEAQAEERELERALPLGAARVDFDAEP
jgi:hypothetical protein